MNIKDFSYNLLKLYQEMSDTFSTYQTSTGLNCLPSCGKCCLNPEIEATLYEMIPMALSIYQEGKLEEWIEIIKSSEQSHCLIYVPGKDEGQGKCGRYQERPGICRMFGVSGYYNKNHEVTLSICKYIKEAHDLKEIPDKLNSEKTPMMVEWTLKLGGLDPRLIQERLPINEALLRALLKVAMIMEYSKEDKKTLSH
jgi:Fe-S-cluster containining protein